MRLPPCRHASAAACVGRSRRRAAGSRRGPRYRGDAGDHARRGSFTKSPTAVTHDGSRRRRLARRLGIEQARASGRRRRSRSHRRRWRTAASTSCGRTRPQYFTRVRIGRGRVGLAQSSGKPAQRRHRDVAGRQSATIADHSGPTAGRARRPRRSAPRVTGCATRARSAIQSTGRRAVADVDQRADEVAHHVMQERVGGDRSSRNAPVAHHSIDSIVRTGVAAWHSLGPKRARSRGRRRQAALPPRSHAIGIERAVAPARAVAPQRGSHRRVESTYQ